VKQFGKFGSYVGLQFLVKLNNKMQEPLISIIIVNYNVKDFLNQAVHSIKKALSGIGAEIFVVDNASRDNSTTMLKENFPNVTLIENKSNVGFAKANNQAISQAKGKYLVLINPDTLVQEDTFCTLVNFLEIHPDAGVVGCKILNPDGSLQLACRRSIPTPWVAFTKLIGLSHLFPKSRLFGKYNLTYLDPDHTTTVDSISGSFMMVRREILDQIGLLDEQFFMYGEDLDWCYRISQSGWKIYYVPETKIIHYKGASAKKAKLDSILIFYRAMLQFARKHFRGKYLFLPQWFLMIGIGIRGGISFFHNLLTRIKWPFIDLVFLNLSLALALLLRFGSLVHWKSYLLVTAIYSAIWLCSFYFFDLYNHRKFSNNRAVLGVLLGLVINSTITYFARNFAFSRLVVLYAGGFNLLLIPGWRLLLGEIAKIGIWAPLDQIRNRYFRKEAILVGDSDSTSYLFEKLNQQYNSDTEVVAALLTDSSSINENGFQSIPVLNNLENLSWYIEEFGANEVIFSSESIPYEKMLGLMSESQKLGTDFKIASKKMEVIIGSSSVDYIGDISLVDIDYRLNHAPYRLIKRTMDLFVAFPALILSIPIWPVLLLSGYKLKKMPIYFNETKTDIEPNQTKVLVFSKNNQSPQLLFEKIPLFYHILKGDMTLVGSELRFQPNDASSIVSSFRLRPGLLTFSRLNAMSVDEQRKYEIFYLKNYSPMFDLEIITKAIFKR